MKTKNPGLLYPIIIILIYPFIMGKTVYTSRLAEYVWSSAASTATDYFLILKMYFFVVLTLGFFAYVFIKDRKFEKGDLRSFAGLILYVLCCVAATFFSVNRSVSLAGANEQFEPLLVLICYALCAYLSWRFIKNAGDMIWIYRAVAVSVCIMGIIGIVQFLILQGKVYLTLYNANYAGVMLAMLIPILYNRIFNGTGSKWESWLYRAALILGAVTLILSGSKSAMVISVWSFLFYLLLRKRKKNLSTGYLVLSLLLGTAFLIYMAMGTAPQETGVSNVVTNSEGVTFERKEEKLTVRFEMPDEESYLFELRDGEGKVIAYEKNEDGTRYQPTDSRFRDYQFTIVEYNDFYGFLVNVDGRDWYFARDEQGIYKYVNGYERLDSFQNARTWLFRGRESFATNRGYLWSRSLPVLGQYFLTGSGPDTFAVVFPQNDVGKYLTTDVPYKMIFTKPHSMYLQIAIQTGLLSLIALLLYLSGVLKRVFRKQNGFFLAIMCYLMTAVFNDSCLCVAPVFFALTGIALAAVREPTSQ